MLAAAVWRYTDQLEKSGKVFDDMAEALKKFADAGVPLTRIERSRLRCGRSRAKPLATWLRPQHRR